MVKWDEPLMPGEGPWRWLELTSWCHLEVDGEVWWLQGGEAVHWDRAASNMGKRVTKEEGIVI